VSGRNGRGSGGGRSVVVTGATAGIGRVTVMELARAGFTVFGTARTHEKADALRKAAADEGLAIETVVCDVADAQSTAQAFDIVAAATDGGPWAVVNNAGYAQPGPVEDVDDVRARAQLEVNVIAPARIAQLVLPTMRARGEGRIVNMSSFGGLISEPFLGWYTASKFALEALSDSLRMEVARYGIQVVLIEPGGFNSDIWQRGVDMLPMTQTSPYADLLGFADAMLAYSKGLPAPDSVGRAVRRALTAARPRERYLVGTDVRVGTALERLLPVSTVDYIKCVRAGLRTPTSVPGRIASTVLTKFL
jgi:NAD(P)-dependent dehydrogenase (short-subunit alcohol dehydrogenase family)